MRNTHNKSVPAGDMRRSGSFKTRSNANLYNNFRLRKMKCARWISVASAIVDGRFVVEGLPSLFLVNSLVLRSCNTGRALIRMKL
jgi:hypothetical protein